jgi:hypothetical protein
MAGPTPITVSWRLTFKYTVRGFQHRAQHFLDVVTSADPSGYDAIGRVTLGNQGVSSLEGRFFTMIAPFYQASTCSFDGYLLEELVSGSWVYRFSDVASVAPSGSTIAQLAFGYGMFGKYEDNTRDNRYIYEVPLTAPNRYTAFGSLAAADQALVDYYFNVSGSPNSEDAWNWEMSRGSSRPQRWISVVIDTNEKLRRLRRIK